MNTRPYTIRDIKRDLNFRVLSLKSSKELKKHHEQLQLRRPTLTSEQWPVFQDALREARDRSIRVSNRDVFDVVMDLGAGCDYDFENFVEHPLTQSLYYDESYFSTRLISSMKPTEISRLIVSHQDWIDHWFIEAVRMKPDFTYLPILLCQHGLKPSNTYVVTQALIKEVNQYNKETRDPQNHIDSYSVVSTWESFCLHMNSHETPIESVFKESMPKHRL